MRNIIKNSNAAPAVAAADQSAPSQQASTLGGQTRSIIVLRA